MKLSRELSRRATGRTLYILDEPTTGLHFHDVAKLLDVLHELVDQGNTVIVIEHNLEVIKTADWIVDLGPEGGDAGGKVVAIGTPEEIAANAQSYTGQYLKQVIDRRRGGKAKRAAEQRSRSTPQAPAEGRPSVSTSLYLCAYTQKSWRGEHGEAKKKASAEFGSDAKSAFSRACREGNAGT